MLAAYNNIGVLEHFITYFRILTHPETKPSHQNLRTSGMFMPWKLTLPHIYLKKNMIRIFYWH